MTSMHRFKGAQMAPYDEVDLLRPVTVENFVWVGMRAMILPGVTLREGTIVGAGAVVTKGLPDMTTIKAEVARLNRQS